MQGGQLRVAAAALLIVWAAHGAALAQSVSVASSAASAGYSQLPLKRDSTRDTSTVETLSWAALLLVAAAAVGFIAVRRKIWGVKGTGPGWLRPATFRDMPKPLGRTWLTPQASLHVVEWNGEELLVGCTAQAVSILGRRASGLMRDDRVAESKA